MNTSVIRHRVADILRRHAPFDCLEEQDLLELAGSGRVRFHESEEYLFQQGEPLRDVIWIVQRGQVDVIVENDGREQLRDVLGEGDMAGLERLADEVAYACSARTATDVVLYAFHAEQFAPLISKYPAVQQYLAAHFSAETDRGSGRISWLDEEAPPPEFLRARFAKAGRGVPMALRATRVDEDAAPEHVLKRVFSGAERTLPPVAAPVSTRKAVLAMIRSRSEAIAILSEDASHSAVEAELSASDLALFCGRNPVGLLREILSASSAEELLPLSRLSRRLLMDAVSRPGDVRNVSRIALEFHAALAETCIRLASAEVIAMGFDPPSVPFCWLAFGQEARGDMILPAFPQLAAVYDDSDGDGGSEPAAYFAALTGRSAVWLRKCGLQGPGISWPDGAHPCMPISEWKRLYSETVRDPMGHELYARRELFDARLLFGDASILDRIRRHLVEELRGRNVMIPLLANDTLSNLPPVTFFRGIVLDLDGGKQENFDAAATMTGPIADAARVFALACPRFEPANTLDRLDAAAADFPQFSRVFRDAADAFQIGVYHQTLAQSPRIDPSTLGRYDQRRFKTAFASALRLLELTATTFITKP